MNDRKGRKFFFMPIPTLATLRAFKGLLDLSEAHDASAKTNFHWQVLKTRQLIFADQNIISSIVPYNYEEIYIIISKTFDLDLLNMVLTKFNMTCSPEIELTSSIYESCVRYSISARIAPLWNPIGGYLIQGRDFLLSNQTLNAIKLDVGKINNQYYIFLWPIRVKLNKVTLKNLDIPYHLIEKLEKNPDFSIDNFNSYLYVFPSLKKGQIWSLSKNIPASCPYSSYKALRRHWKNMYGYRLPEESSEDAFYLQILFRYPKPTLYHYPNICLNTTEIIFYQKVDFQEVYSTFSKDLNKKMPTICGFSFINLCELGVAQMKTVEEIAHDSCEDFLQFTKSSNLLPLEPTIISNNSQAVSETLDTNISLMTPQYHEKSQDIIPNKKSVFNMEPKNRNVPLQFPFEAQTNVHFSASQTNRLIDPSQKTRGNFRTQPYPSPHSFQRMIFNPNFYASHYLGQSSNEMRNINNSQFSRMNNQLTNENEFDLEHFIAYNSKALEQTNSIPLNLSMQNSNLLHYAHDKGPFKTKEELEVYEKLMIKKPRSKPQIQIGLDIEQMAKEGDLSKANSATLIDWLKSKSVYCKAKEKKTDLVEKVNQYLGIE